MTTPNQVTPSPCTDAELEERAKEYTEGCDNESDSFLGRDLEKIRSKAFKAGSLSERAQLSRLIEDEVKAVNDFCRDFPHNWDNEWNIFRRGARFMASLKNAKIASLEYDLTRMTYFKDQYENLMNEFNKKYQKERVVSAELEAKLKEQGK